MKYAELPIGWDESTLEVGEPIDGDEERPEYNALWVAKDEKITIDAHHNVDEPVGEISYPIVVEQVVESDGYSTTVQTHAMVEETRRDVEETVSQFMAEVNDGHHVLRALSARLWEEFVQFYCIHDSQVPGEMTSKDLVDAIEGHAEPDNVETAGEVENVPDDVTGESEAIVDVDIIPRHVSEVTEEKE